MTITGSQDPNNPTANDPASSTGAPQAAPPSPIPSVLTPPTPQTPTLAPQQPPAQQTAPTQGGTTPALVNTPANANPSSSLHARLFDGILQTLSGGPSQVQQTDPVTGQTRTITQPQSRSKMGQTVLAAVLSGLFSGADARDPSGRHDPVAAAAAGFQAGKGVVDQKNAKAQEQADQMLSRQQLVMKNNIDLAHTAIASAHQQHVDLQDTIDRNQAGILHDVKAYDDLQSDPTQKIVLANGLTHDQALAKLKGNLTTQNAVIDGSVDVWNPDTKAYAPEPTYSILNPDVKIKMNEQQAANLARFKPQYQNAYDATGGNILLPVRNYLADVNDEHTIENVESFFKRASDQLGIKDVDLAAAVKNSGPAGLQAIKEAENAIAQQGTPVDALARIQSAPGGQKILDSLGISNKQIQDAKDAQKAAEREATALGDKAPADSAAIAQIPTLARNLGLSPAESAAATAELPKTGATRADVAKVLENIRHQHDTNAQLSAGALRDQGDPAMIERVARNLVDNPASLTTMRDIGTRGTQRLAIIDKAEQIAQSEGKQFDTGLINQRVDFLKQYEDPKGKAAINRQAVNNIMMHAADVSDLNQLNRRGNVKIVNTPVNALKDQFGDQVYTQYQTATNVLKDELGLYFAGGYSPTKTQQETWDKIQSDTATPAQTEQFAKEVVRLASRRADTFNEQFKTNMGYNDPNMVTPQAKKAAERLGLGDVVAKFGSGGQLGVTPPYVPVAGDRPIMKDGKTVGYLSVDGTRH